MDSTKSVLKNQGGAIDLVLSRLPDAKQNGNDCSARCPAHDDRRASLSIGVGDDGRVLLHCHAGCETSAIVGKIGLTMKDLMPSKNGSAKKGKAKRGKTKPVSTAKGLVSYYIRALTKEYGGGVTHAGSWQYNDDFYVLRFNLPTPDGEKQRKEFRPATKVGNGWIAAFPDSPRPLYHKKEIIDATDVSLTTVHGGEKATGAAAGLGLLATCNAGGEQAIGKTDWTPLAKFTTAAIVIDADATGEKFGREVTAILKKQNPDQVVKIIRLPDLPPKGDVVEWITAGGTRQVFLRIVADTPDVTAEDIAEWNKAKQKKNCKADHVYNGEWIENPDSESGGYYEPLPMADILGRIWQDGWPRRVGSALFVDDKKKICWLESPAALFGWLQSNRGVIGWKRGEGFATKEETFAELRRVALDCISVEPFPHEPRLTGHYYCCPDLPPGDGTALKTFLDFFCPATPIDRQLITACAATLFWGGPPGSRSAFMFTSPGRGKGKTKAAMFLSRLVGGSLDLSPHEEIGLIKSRLLSPEASSKRICLLDNVKTTRFSWGELEALITADSISGRRLYVGEGSRPNLLTWLITLNGASLSTDMAQRVVEICLGEPTYRPSWEEEISAFVGENQWKIIADLIAFLQRKPGSLPSSTRWALWEREILSKVDNPAECLAAILHRREQADIELEEGALLDDYFSTKLQQLDYDIKTCDVYIPTILAGQWFVEAVGDRGMKPAGASRRLRQMIREKQVKTIVEYRVAGQGSRGFRFMGQYSAIEDPTSYDLECRLADVWKDKV